MATDLGIGPGFLAGAILAQARLFKPKPAFSSAILAQARLFKPKPAFSRGDTGFWQGTKVSGRARKKMEVKFCRRRRQHFTDLMRPKAAFGPCLQANWIGIC